MNLEGPIMRLRVLFISFVAILFAAISAFGEYTYKDNYYWKDGVPYERWAYYYPSHNYSGYSYGGRYYRIEYEYVRAYPQPRKESSVALPTPNDPAWRTKLLEIAAFRDKGEIQSRLSAFEHSSFLEAVNALGLKGNFTLHGYGVSPVYPMTSGYVTGTQYGNHGIQGQTVYGYGSQFTADLYGQALDVNLAFQQGSNLVQNSQQLAGQGFSDLAGIISQSSDRQARIAEIIAKGIQGREAIKAMMEGLKAEPRTTITQKDFGFRSAPAPVDTAMDDVMKNVLMPACASCHSGAKVEGKFNIETYPSMSLAEKASRVWKRILTDDETIRMPRSRDGGPGPRLSPAAVKKILAN